MASRKEFEALRAGILDSEGFSSAALRRAVADRVRALIGGARTGATGPIDDEVRHLVDKIERHAYRVADIDIQKLLTHLTEEELFEIVVAAAVESGAVRAERGFEALEELDATHDP